AFIRVDAGLFAHFTAAATGILLGLLVGILTAHRPLPARHRWAKARTGLLGVWVVGFAVLTAAEVPLASAIKAQTAAEAHANFETAQSLRPWDADVTSIAAHMMTARADGGDAAAVGAAVHWAERAASNLA